LQTSVTFVDRGGLQFGTVPVIEGLRISAPSFGASGPWWCAAATDLPSSEQLVLPEKDEIAALVSPRLPSENGRLQEVPAPQRF
jgi:hypothetical protein